MIISNTTKTIRSMTISASMLSLAIIVSFITNFIKLSFLSSFLTLDLSLIFIIPLIYFLNFKWSLLNSFLLGLFSLFWSSGLWIGPLFNIIYNISLISLIYFFHFFVFKKMKNLKIKIFFTLIFTLIIMIFLSTILNAIIFQPLYWWVFNIIKKPSFIDAQNVYNSNPSIYLLYINNYWTGTLYLYGFFNLIKLSIIFIFLFTPLYLINKYSISKIYMYKI